MTAQLDSSAYVYQIRRTGVKSYNPNGWEPGEAGNFYASRAVVVINK